VAVELVLSMMERSKDQDEFRIVTFSLSSTITR